MGCLFSRVKQYYTDPNTDLFSNPIADSAGGGWVLSTRAEREAGVTKAPKGFPAHRRDEGGVGSS